MTEPNYTSEPWVRISFWGDNFREVMTKFLNWLDEPRPKKYRKPNGEEGTLNYTNDHYVLHDTLQVEWDCENADYTISIFMGE